MTKKFLSILSVLFIAGGAATALAASPQDGRLDDLKDKRAEVATAGKLIGGGPRLRLESERRRLDELIDDLESGRSVDPNEIDRALKEPTLLH